MLTNGVHAWSELRVLSAAILLAGWMAFPVGGAAQPARFEFGLIGDLPYSGEDEAQFPVLIQALNEAPLAFVMHIGDFESSPRRYKATKTGAVPCTDDTFAQRKALFQTSKHPFIFIPGDNDWTDCHEAEPSLEPAERLAQLRELYFQGDQSLGQRTLRLTRQSADPPYAKFRENAR